MNYTDYLQVKEDFITQLAPQKEVDLAEIQHESDQLYTVDGVEVLASKHFADSYDALIGIKPKQKALVRNASGETGLSNYRNYQSVAMSIHRPQRVLLVASPESRQLTEIIPIVEEYIAPTLFFEFAEMVAHETGYEIVGVHYRPSDSIRVTITFQSRESRPELFLPGEDFLMDGFYLSWDPASVSAGHYFERLACSNGQTVRERHSDGMAHRLGEQEMRQMIGLLRSEDFRLMGAETFRDLIATAYESRISLAEMKSCQRTLLSLGVSKVMAEEMVPYETLCKSYLQAGTYDSQKERITKGEGTVWDAYNVLTEFATHTTLWGAQDHKRISLMNKATTMLRKKPDIVSYIEI
ncbi:hypothetical protein [uncultured Porphyromonas sp.]|uniref:hypothetical protein n=1 Tax=uncultured Porphyromonas sp. TaxID=159274 RepID=UPI0028048C23|nr:hypothetical protein [uncultured Porphyromonas sp.]